MQPIEILGLFQNALSGSVFISIYGPTPFHFSERIIGNFDLKFNLRPGDYRVGLNVDTDGTFTINVKGAIQNASPQLPYTLTSDFDEINFTV